MAQPRTRDELVSRALRILGVFTTGDDTGDPRTRRELVDKALAILGVLTPGNAPSATDVRDVDAYIDGLLAQLATRGIISGVNTTAIQARYFVPLATLLADAAKQEYGATVEGIEDAEAKLLRMNPRDVDAYIDGLLDELEAREIIGGVDPAEIEARFFTPLAILLADAAKFEYGVASVDGVQDAENKLRHMKRSGPTYEPLQMVDY